VLACLSEDLHMAQLMQLRLTVLSLTPVNPDWYQLTWAVPNKGPLNVCMYVCISSLWNY